MSNQYSKHDTQITGDIHGPVHTGSGDIYLFNQAQMVTLTEQEKKTLLDEYATWQRKIYAYLPLLGIPLPRQFDTDIQLDKIYIKLRALPQQRQSEDITSFKHSVTLEDALQFVKSFGELQWQRYQESDPSSMLEGRFSDEIILPEQAISNHNNVVIIGLPGSGKSTLLRHITWEQANEPHYPIHLFIPLGRVDILMAEHRLSLLDAALDILTEHVVAGSKIKLRSALASSIENKQVRLLFDGLDEVHACKQEIVATLTALTANGNRIVVTSRPIGYERLLGFEHYEVLPLQSEDAFTFSTRWFRYLAEAHGVEKEQQQEWSIERSKWLQSQLESRQSLREIARIPLLLTFLAILAGDEPGDELPRYRKDLYAKYIDKMRMRYAEL